ncbi:MAG: hypothetical protein KA953_00685 [Lachnospiraceae bacterium]|nr:hypothetical protein [Lachnospiraceae bacterium]
MRYTKTEIEFIKRNKIKALKINEIVGRRILVAETNHRVIEIDDYDKYDCFMFEQLEPDIWYPVKKYWKK